MRSITRTTLCALAAAAMAAPAYAAAADYYLTLGDVKSDPAGGKVREAAARSAANMRVEVMSWSFGASQTSHAGGGMGAGKVNMQDISITRTAPVPADYNGDGKADRVAAADFDGDGRADRSVESPGATVATAARKRAHQPVGRGSVTLVGKFPACTVGGAYKDAKLQVAGVRYTLENILITGCAATPGSSGGEPAQSLSLNYVKITLDR